VAGRRVGTLQIADVKVQPAPASPVGSSGSIRFKGELQLTGQYRAHYEYPEKQEACFWPDVQEWRLLPRANGDSRAIWFCFSNKDKAIKLLGPLGTESQATIVVDNYTTNLATSDVWDTAKLVKVVSKTSK
jgi:hypothetical protein